MANNLFQEVKEALRDRFNAKSKANIEKKANLLIKNIAKEKSGAIYRKAFLKEHLKQVKLKARLDAQATFKKPNGQEVKAKVKANLNEIIKGVSPKPTKTNADFDLGYRSLY